VCLPMAERAARALQGIHQYTNYGPDNSRPIVGLAVLEGIQTRLRLRDSINLLILRTTWTG